MDASSAEYLAALIDQRDLNLNTWNFFVSVHLALGGALIIIQRRIKTIEKLLIFLGYSLFMAMTYTAQLANYAFFARLSDTWETIYEPAYAAEGAEVRPDLTLGLPELPFLDLALGQKTIIQACFALCFVGMMLLIFNVNRLARKD